MKVCENCGTVANFIEGYCKACNSKKIIDLQISTEDWFKLNKNQKETKIKNCLSLSDEQYELLQEAWENNKTNVASAKSNAHSETRIKNVPKCPTCGSTNIKRITTLNRAVSVGTLGLLSGKIGKNYECLNCKAKW